MDCHKQDVDGCNYIMDVVSSYYPTIEWVHTEGEYDRYDMDWVVTTTDGREIECKAEGKDRRRNKDGNPINMETYDTAFLNSGKFRYMINNIKHPYVLIGYSDGVLLYNLKKLPYEEIINDIDSCIYDNVYRRLHKQTKWCSWNYVWNPAIRQKQWELNVLLPISERGNYKGITVLKK